MNKNTFNKNFFNFINKSTCSFTCINYIKNILKKKGFIELYNMEGFIGGASGLIDNKTLCFNGNIKTHPDAENIKSFCKNAGVDVISLNNGNLKDIGSILVF